MISRDQAVEAAIHHLSQPDPHRPDRDLVVTRVEERPASWVVFYDSKRHIETGEAIHAIAGNGPLVIGKESGRLVAAGTAYSVEQEIAKAQAALGDG